MSPLVVPWLYAVVAFVAAVVLTGAMRRYAIRTNLLDVPNARSSHARPIPRGGGVAIVVVVLSGLALLAFSRRVDASVAMVLIACGAFVAIVGFVDDRRGLSARVRFTVHLLAAVAYLALAGGVPASGWPALDALPWLGFPLVALAVVWLLNLYNFMDGIDGIAGVEAVCVSAGLLAAVLLAGGGGSAVPLALLIGGASLGFLIWNWSPARIFMGDAGSGFLGFFLAVLSLEAVHAGRVPLAVPVILLASFVADATYTLARRVLAGARWYEAHRTHAYQKLALRLGSHRRVVLGMLAFNLMWLWPTALLALRQPQWQWLYALLAYAPVLVLAAVIGAGRAESVARC